MTAAVDQHTHTAADRPAADPGNIGVPVCYSVAEPNRLGLARIPGGADIDVARPGCEKFAGASTDGGVVDAGGIVAEGIPTERRVVRRRAVRERLVAEAAVSGKPLMLLASAKAPKAVLNEVVLLLSACYHKRC